MKQVLIAHQSTIPHYRVPFYNSLNTLKPDEWRFEVVFDPDEVTNPRFFKGKINSAEFDFPTWEVRTFRTSFLGKPISYQTFLNYARNFDLLILEDAVNNLAYPLCQFHKIFGKKIVYWGHGKDRKYSGSSYIKDVSEWLKLHLVRNSDGFFAYTPGVKEFLISKGISRDNIFVLNNTIDIREQRRTFESYFPHRESLRESFNLKGKKVIIFVGRFSPNKRIDYLLRSFEKISKLSSELHMIVVGEGNISFEKQLHNMDNLTYTGPITAVDELAKYYVMSDMFVIPGAVGLGPLQALCYDLPAIALDSLHHGPEFEYLNSCNSMIFPSHIEPEQFAQIIIDLFSNASKLEYLKMNCWPTIKHLTIENMAKNFILGVSQVLDQ